jgi:hypothetical protein
LKNNGFIQWIRILILAPEHPSALFYREHRLITST